MEFSSSGVTADGCVVAGGDASDLWKVFESGIAAGLARDLLLLRHPERSAAESKDLARKDAVQARPFGSLRMTEDPAAAMTFVRSAVAQPDQETTHGYFEWQVSTLMLAYDAVEPLARDDVAQQQKRQEAVEQEVREVSMAVIPEGYHANETQELAPEVVMRITRATLRRASEVVGLL